MRQTLDALAAVEQLAESYSTIEAQRGVWRAAAMVRRQMANTSQTELERQHHAQLASVCEGRETAT